MKLVKFGQQRQAMLLNSGAQVLFDREVPILLKHKDGKWYRRLDELPRLIQYVDDYLKMSGQNIAFPKSEDEFLDLVESV